MWMIVRHIFRWLGQLLGIKREQAPSPEQQAWQGLLFRYRVTQVQLREAGSPDELETAHCAFMAAQADLQWHVRMAKRARGLALRPIAENYRTHQELIQRLTRQQSGAASAAPAPSAPLPGGSSGSPAGPAPSAMP